MSRPLLIGGFARTDCPGVPVLDLGGVWSRTLHSLEQSLVHRVISRNVVPVMVPAVDRDKVTFCATLYQAIPTQRPDALPHLDPGVCSRCWTTRSSDCLRWGIERIDRIDFAGECASSVDSRVPEGCSQDARRRTWLATG